MNRFLFPILLATAVILVPPFFVFAQSIIDVSVNKVTVDFPNKATFYLEAKGDTDIKNAVLVYGTNSRTCQDNTGRQPLTFDPSSQISVNWEWDWMRSGVIPPGAEIWWQWEITDKAGFSLTTPVQRFEIQDQRHKWKTASRETVNVQWYLGDEQFGKAVLALATNSLNKLTKDYGLALSDEINITVYPSMEEVREVLLVATGWTAGVAIPDYNSIIGGISSDELDWAKELIPHEISHIVVSSMVFNCQGVFTPSWLDEGLAELVENPQTEDEKGLVELALAGNKLPSLGSLERGFSAFSDSATLSYAQSKLVVDYLIREYGEDKLALLLASIQEGNRIDPALQKIYGFETNGLDKLWRTAMGYPGASLGSTVPTGISFTPTVIPTFPLMVLVNPVTETAASTEEQIENTSTIEPSESPPPLMSATPVGQDAGKTPTVPAADLSTESEIVVVFIIIGAALVAAAFFFTFRKRRE